jgi:hypothetical protein
VWLNATAFSSFLKLPAAGSRNGFNGDLNDRGSVAFLWVGAGAAKNSAAKSTLNWLIKITKKPSQNRLIPARARFKEITNSAKLVILLIIPTYAKVSLSIIFFL